MRRPAPSAAVVVASAALLIVAVVAVVLIRGDEEPLTPRSVADPSPTLAVPDALPAHDAVAAALTLIPLDATTATVTDWDAIRARFGVPDLTGEDLMADRQAFWRRAEADAVLLTDGLLRDDTSTLLLDHGFTQDDVDWEARWTGPDGAGYALAFRPALDMGSVEDAVDAGVGPLADAEVRPADHLVVEGSTDGLVWASDPTLAGLVAEPEESTYLRRGCVPVDDALGPDADVEDQDALLAERDVRELEPLAAVGLSFGDAVATAWLGSDRNDLFARGDLVPHWPVTGAVGPMDAFADEPVVDPTTGRMGFRISAPRAAATLTLTEILPFAVCNEVVPLDEPTGL